MQESVQAAPPATDLQEENEKLKQEAKENETTIQRLAPLVSDLEAENAEISRENDELKKSIVEKGNQLMQQQIELDERDAKMKKLEETLKNQENLKEGALAEVEKLQKNEPQKYEELLIENTQLSDTCKALQETTDEALNETEKLKEENTDLKQKLDTTEQENKVLKERESDIQEQESRNAIETAAKLKALDEVKSLRDENRELKETSEAKTKEMENEIQKKEAEVKDLEEKLIEINERPLVVNQAPQAVQSTKMNLLQDQRSALFTS